MNNSIIYWKWDKDIFDEKILKEKITDLCDRTEIGNIFIGMEWIREDFQGENISKAFKYGIKLMHERGRKVMIECCVRGEGEKFYQEYPNDRAYLVSCYESGDLVKEGKFYIPHEPVWHYWKKTGDNGEHKLFSAFAVVKNGDHSFASIRKLDNVKTKAVKSGEGYEIEVSYSEIKSGEKIVVCIGFPQPIPDLASDNLIPFFTKMAKHAKTLDADGLFSDEWGYDIILKIVKQNPYDDTELNLRHISYSDSFERKYQEINNEPLFDNIIKLYYSYGNDEERKAIIDNYLKTLRLICTQNEEQMYDVVKKEIGKDAFWGVHPTWWGSVDKQNFEFFKNGFYWWDAKRDIAQTDEMVLYAIRSSLAHRFKSPIWYNMWYSMGTRDIKTYYVETWNNLRFNGRTHYLGYECPNEAVVLDLKPQGLLEGVEFLDKRIRLFDSVTSQPDCRLLVLFGYEDVSNWADIGMEIPWVPENERLQNVLNTTNELFNDILCDLVPSYSVENNTLFINEKGKAQFGNQEYDGAIVMYANRMSKEAKEFVSKLDTSKLIITGTDGFEELKNNGARVYKKFLSSKDLLPLIENMNIEKNRSELGCVLQDGSVIFSVKGDKPQGNILKVNCTLAGKHIEFEGEDAFWISKDCKQKICPSGKIVVDGKEI